MIAPTATASRQPHGLIARKGTHVLSVCIPARDEATTIATVVETVIELRHARLVDEVIVIDDHSTDDTARDARTAGAGVIANPHAPGKGGALRTAARCASGDLLLFLDGDVTSYTGAQIASLFAPLLGDPAIQLVKATYSRPCAGLAQEGGRVTELLARPLLERLHPDLAHLGQPLAGETAIRRSALDQVSLSDGYGIEIGLLIDIARRYGAEAIAEVDLGERTHRNRPLRQLHDHARDVLAAVLDRTPALPQGDH